MKGKRLLISDNLKESNNFDAVRIMLALIVFFSHLPGLTGSSDIRYFESLFDADFAVKGFFAISGYLVSASFVNSSNTYDFFERRIRRIYPAYLGAVALCFCIGMATSQFGVAGFLTSAATGRYLLFNALFLNFVQPTLPGVFLANPLQAMDGSLWTIKIEVMLYLCVPILVYLAQRFSALMIACICVLVSAIWVYCFAHLSTLSIGPEIARQFPGQLAYFGCGAMLTMDSRGLKYLRWMAPCALISLVAVDDTLAKVFLDPLAYTVLVLFACTLNAKHLNFGKYGDVSYGIYLYHFPIIQLLVALNLFKANVYLGIVVSLGLTLLVSLLSWHLLEKPWLKRTSHYVEAASA